MVVRPSLGEKSKGNHEFFREGVTKYEHPLWKVLYRARINLAKVSESFSTDFTDFYDLRIFQFGFQYGSTALSTE